jgi:hypothetical protein
LNFYWILGGLFNAAPGLITWTIALVLSSIMLKRSKGRAELFLVVGSSVLLFNSVLHVPSDVILQWLGQRAINGEQIGLYLRTSALVFGVLNLVGIILLFKAFWIKFHQKKNQEINQSTSAD